MYEYKVNILKVVDGDTVDVDIDLGFGVWLRNERVRLAGIDTPESRTSDAVEKVFGQAAKDRVNSLLGDEATLISQITKNGENMKMSSLFSKKTRKKKNVKKKHLNK